MRPLISVVMPVYNSQRYVKKALDSIVTQGFSDYEFVVVNDGSTDSTLSILEEYAVRFPGVFRIFTTENKGVYAAYNLAVENAEGQYILSLNSDDYYMPGSLETLAGYLAEYDYDVVFINTATHEVDYRQNILRKNIQSGRMEQPFRLRGAEAVRDAWLSIMKLGLVRNNINLYKAELMKAHPFDERYYGADLLFNIDIADEVTSAACDAANLYQNLSYIDPETKKGHNVSVGKFYPYEHEMYNVFFNRHYELFLNWGRLDPMVYAALAHTRAEQWKKELSSLQAENTGMTAREKLSWIGRNFDEVSVVSLEATGGREKFEELVLAYALKLCREAGTEPAGDGPFLEKLLAGVLAAKRNPQKAAELVREAMRDPGNPNKLGLTYYKKMAAENSPESREAQMLLEVAHCRYLVHALQLQKARPLVEALLAGNGQDPQLYSVAACYYLYSGDVKKGEAVLQKGLAVYPGDHDLSENMDYVKNIQ